MSGARWFPAAGIDTDTWTLSAGHTGNNAAASKRKTREVFTWMRVRGEEMNGSRNNNNNH